MERVIEPAEDFRIGRVVSRLFDTLFANPLTVLALAGLLLLPALLIPLYFAFYPAGQAIALGADLLQTAAYMILGCVLEASLMQATILYLNREVPGFGQCLSTGIKSFFPILAISLLTVVGVGLGLLLLVVPGIILLLMRQVVVPVRVVEHAGIIESFGRSRELTRGHRGAIFLLALIYGALALALTLATRPLMGFPGLVPEPGELHASYIFVDWLEGSVTTTLLAVGTASVYYELRLVKEGIGAQQMAAAFD